MAFHFEQDHVTPHDRMHDWCFVQDEKSLAGRTMTLVALQLALQVSFGSIDVCFLFRRNGSCILSDFI